MVAQERHAWFNAVVSIAALGLFGALIPVLGLVRAQAAFALLALLALGPIFYRKRAGQVIADERDRLINHRAAQVAFAGFWILFVVGLVGLYFQKSNQGTISVEILPFIVWGGFVIFQLAHSVTTLILYRRS